MDNIIYRYNDIENMSLIDQPDKLLEIIDLCLKPKQNEKKKFGEVFTPIKLDISIYYKKLFHYAGTNN